jgi:copper chaperone NosL
MKSSSILMIIGSALLLGLFVFPLWSIELEAPQYPNGIGMNIHLDGLQGKEKHDLQNIDGLNHYIGMRKLPKPEDMWEFSAFPKIIGSMSILGILIGLLSLFKRISPKWFLGWLVLMSILGVLGMYDFNAWMVDYGTNLDPKAIMKMTDADGNPLSYKPPLFGTKHILNFVAHSYPSTGAYMMGFGMFLTFVAFWLGNKKLKTIIA